MWAYTLNSRFRMVLAIVCNNATVLIRTNRPIDRTQGIPRSDKNIFVSHLKVWREGNSNFWGEKGFIIQLVLKNIIVKCSQVYSNHCLQLFLSLWPVTHGTISHQLIINHCHLDPCHKEVNVLGRRTFDWLLHLVPVCPVVLKAEGESILIFSYIWLPFTPGSRILRGNRQEPIFQTIKLT